MDTKSLLTVKRYGRRIGYTTGYFLFTTGLFLILTLLDKTPHSFPYFSVMGITAAVTSAGSILKRFLK